MREIVNFGWSLELFWNLNIQFYGKNCFLVVENWGTLFHAALNGVEWNGMGWDGMGWNGIELN